MPTSYLVTTKSAHGAKTSNARYATVDDALGDIIGKTILPEGWMAAIRATANF